MASSVYINKPVIQKQVSAIINEVTGKEIRTNAIDYFVFSTKEQVKNYNALQDLRQQVKDMNKRLNMEVPLEVYFQAYELILDIRKFFLGDLGEIDYNILFSIKQRGGDASINTINISHELFRNLLMDENGKIKGLIDSGGNLRFNTSLLKSLKLILNNLRKQGVDISILENANSFRIKNQVVGKSSNFSSAKLFKAQIEKAKNRQGLRYLFSIDVKKAISKQQKAVFSFFISKVEGKPESSSIFSAIGKYSADEQLTKEQLVKKHYGQTISVPSTNIGNLSEIYELAKIKLNKNKNKFKKRTAVSGQDLYQIYSEVLKNTDPFYMGGDILTTQIKSFLGSCPSLTSFSTLRLSIKKFDQALQQSDFKKLKEKISDLLIKKEDSLLKEQKKLSKSLADALNETFKSLEK